MTRQRADVSAEVPARAYAPVVVVEPDPTWADRGRALAADLDQLLHRWRTGAVEHVGSPTCT